MHTRFVYFWFWSNRQFRSNSPKMTMSRHNFWILLSTLVFILPTVSMKNTYCQGCKFAGRELIDVKLIPFSLNCTSTSHNAPGSSFGSVNITDVTFRTSWLLVSCAGGSLYPNIKNLVVLVTLSSILALRIGKLYSLELISEDIAADLFDLSWLTNSAAFEVDPTSILVIFLGNVDKYPPTCVQTCGWEYIVSISFKDPLLNKLWCIDTNCSPTILNWHCFFSSRNQSRSKS